MTLAQDWEDVKRGLAQVPDSTLARVVAGLAAAPGRAVAPPESRPPGDWRAQYTREYGTFPERWSQVLGGRPAMAPPGGIVPREPTDLEMQEKARAEAEEMQAKATLDWLKEKQGSDRLMAELFLRKKKARNKLLLMIAKKRQKGMEEQQKAEEKSLAEKNKAAGQPAAKPLPTPFDTSSVVRGDGGAVPRQVQTAAEAGQPADGGGSLGEAMRSRMAGVPPTRESVQTVTEWGPHRWGSGTVPMATWRTVRTQMPTGLTQAQAAELAVREHTARRIDRQVAAEITAQKNRDLVTYAMLTGSVDDAIAFVNGGTMSKAGQQRLAAAVARQTGRRERSEDIDNLAKLAQAQYWMQSKGNGVRRKVETGVYRDPTEIKLWEVMPGDLEPLPPGTNQRLALQELSRSLAKVDEDVTPEQIGAMVPTAAQMNMMVAWRGKEHWYGDETGLALVDAGDVFGDMMLAYNGSGEEREAALARLRTQKIVGGMDKYGFTSVKDHAMSTASEAYISAFDRVLMLTTELFPQLQVLTPEQRAYRDRMQAEAGAANSIVMPMADRMIQDIFKDYMTRSQ